MTARESERERDTQRRCAQLKGGREREKEREKEKERDRERERSL